jgi:hypothetical protein
VPVPHLIVKKAQVFFACCLLRLNDFFLVWLVAGPSLQ